ncbi:uncharacterized protein LOC127239556 [Andrographis paniculata]|uniref:uncharacterized protein LOC127239556 n=1 Tax=Andrographis paniculata TaxID=175694 RepID=UPI0021E7C7CE|nr:uncharacterized protein LOC127239556 [Andrographis paniculata]
MKPQEVIEDQIKLRVFPFSLKDTEKDWLFNLPAGNVTTWTDMKKKFLEKYFPVSRAAIMRKKICQMTQHTWESLFEYWDRFNALLIRCPHHQIPVQLLIQYFYEGLTSIDRRIIDAASGGALMNKTPRDVWDLLNNMTMNSQQFRPREAVAIKEASDEHPTAICPTLSQKVDVSVAGFIPRAYNHYSNTYNPGWNDQSNLKYGNRQTNFEDHSRGFSAPNHPPQPSQTVPSNSSEDMMKTMASKMLQFQQETRNSIRNLEE